MTVGSVLSLNIASSKRGGILVQDSVDAGVFVFVNRTHWLRGKLMERFAIANPCSA